MENPEIDLGAAFRSLGMADDLTDAELTELANVCRLEKFDKDQPIFREGQHHARIYWVLSGLVRLEMKLPTRPPTALLTVGTGEVLAWSALLGTQQMTATGIAASDTVLIGFDATALQALCDRNHQLGYRLMRHLCKGISQRLVATRLQLLDLFSHPHQQTT
jgi:CRP-like cAMP-binding protein